MNQKLLNLLHRVIGSKGTKLKKNDEYMYWSPFISHHKPQLQVNVFTQKWHCWVSNEGGHTLFQLFKKLNVTNDQFTELREIIGETTYSSVQVKDEQTKKVELPKEFLSLAYKHPSPVYGHAMFYLSNRGITYEDILKYNIGYCDEGLYTNQVIIPSYDDNGQLNFFVGRDIFESKMKYRNSPTTKDVIGFELFINWDEPIVLCEGPFDAIAIKRNAIPLFGKTIMRNLKKKIYENSVKKIYLALDEDAIIDSIKITEEFSKNEINVYLIKLLKKDPSEIGFKNFVYLINDTKKTTFSDLVKLKLNGKKRKYMEI